jgi:hypothetical protein
VENGGAFSTRQVRATSGRGSDEPLGFHGDSCSG